MHHRGVVIYEATVFSCIIEVVVIERGQERIVKFVAYRKPCAFTIHVAAAMSRNGGVTGDSNLGVVSRLP